MTSTTPEGRTTRFPTSEDINDPSSAPPLPALPFTWPQGRSWYRLYIFLGTAWIEVCALPIALYYGLHFGSGLKDWVTFTIITAVWGFNIYYQTSVRSWKLFRNEFYRPLGVKNKWALDITAWIACLSIMAAMAPLIIGTTPNSVWVRVISMTAPALLYCIGGSLSLITIWHSMHWRAPFRISSTNKGERVKPGVYYIVEDVAAVDANQGRPYREALSARFAASARFQQMMFKQSILWAGPSLILAVGLTVIAVSHPVPRSVAFGICRHPYNRRRSDFVLTLHRYRCPLYLDPILGLDQSCDGEERSDSREITMGQFQSGR